MPQRVDLLIIGAAHRPGVCAAEEEKLGVKRFLRHHAEQIVHVIGLLDLVQPCDEPGIGDLGIQLLILLRQRLQLFGGSIYQRQLGMPLLQQPALFGGHAVGGELLVIVDVHGVGVVVPVPDHPFERRVLHDRAPHFVRDLGGVELRLMPHALAGEFMLGKICQKSRHQHAERKQNRDLQDETAAKGIPLHPGPFRLPPSESRRIRSPQKFPEWFRRC